MDSMCDILHDGHLYLSMGNNEKSKFYTRRENLVYISVKIA
jgi:hypothetical protein